MIEPYSGAFIRPRRHRDGSWSAFFGGGDLTLKTSAHQGKGAKSKAIEEAKTRIDSLTQEEINALCYRREEEE